MPHIKQPPFLPMNLAQMKNLGWDSLDILLISGDAYIDHPSFAMALLGRWLISEGYRVGIITQPRWDTTEDITRCGRPRLFCGIGAGALDSMLAHYTAFRKKRHNDAYTPGGQAGARPNRAAIVYTGLAKHAFPGLPVVIGGIEASLRRASHYDFWSSSIRRPIVLDSKADILVYGMGESAISTIAQRCRQAQGSSVELANIPGTAIVVNKPVETVLAELPENSRLCLPSHEEICQTPAKLMEATMLLEHQVHQASQTALQGVAQRTVVIYPPAPPLSTARMDFLYSLPYQRCAHPAYEQPIPAQAMISSSITTHRGCGGGCSFCSLALHQGRRLASRSAKSILEEAKLLGRDKSFHGSISDIGGPSANMWQGQCTADPSVCQRTSCLTPKPCPSFRCPQNKYVSLLREVAALPEVKHLRVSSGIRHDLALRDEAALKAYATEFTGGQLKIAPEHVCPRVLELMRKPPKELLEDFVSRFTRYSAACGKEQYVIPYLISAFPGCTMEHMRELAAWLKARNWQPQQVQCFIPTPGTVATAMFYAQIDPQGHPIHVATSDAERLQQHSLISPQQDSYSNRLRGRTAAPQHSSPEKQAHSSRGSHTRTGNTRTGNTRTKPAANRHRFGK